MSSLTTSKAWTALQSHYHQTKNNSLCDAFKGDTNRFNKFSVNFNEILFDYSKNRIADQTLPLLIDLANHAGLDAKIKAMFSGEKSTPPNIGPSCTPPYAIEAIIRFMLMDRMSCPKLTGF